MKYRQRCGATLGLLALLCVVVHAVPGVDQPADCGDCRDCSDVTIPAGRHSYLVTLKPSPNKTVQALCVLLSDQVGRRPWTAIQNRVLHSGLPGLPAVNFTRGWEDYKKGFGHMKAGMYGSFWWGNENMWLLSSLPDRRYELKVVVSGLVRRDSVKPQSFAAGYLGFKVSSERDGYRLTLGNYTKETEGAYYKIAGDGLSWHSGMKFTTIDCDEDNLDGDNCARIAKGGWWYNGADGTCHEANLNGPYHKPSGSNNEASISWFPIDEEMHDLFYGMMAIRPININ